jgi:hypothetical protein
MHTIANVHFEDSFLELNPRSVIKNAYSCNAYIARNGLVLVSFARRLDEAEVLRS